MGIDLYSINLILAQHKFLLPTAAAIEVYFFAIV